MFVCLFVCFLTNRVARNQIISDIQIEWGRTGGGNRERKPVLLGFLHDRSGPKSTPASRERLFFGVGLTSRGWVRALPHAMLELPNPFGFSSSQRSYFTGLHRPTRGRADLVGGEEDGGRGGADGPVARPQQGGRDGRRLEERGGGPGRQGQRGGHGGGGGQGRGQEGWGQRLHHVFLECKFCC